MRIKSYAYRILGAVCAFATIACVDQSFDLNNVSKEVTVGSGKTTLPIGYIEDKTLGDLLEGQDIEGLTIDENGNLSFGYEGESETINIEGISTEFEIPQIANAFKVEYPSFNFDMRAIAIEANETINVGGFDSFSGTNFTIPEDINIPITGNYTKVFEGDNLHIEFDVPEQINNINKIYFRDIEVGHYGAPMHIHVDFNGLADVNGGGDIEFVLNIEGGSFRILDADNKLICDGNTYGNTYPVASGTDSIDFVIYVESITNNTALDGNHHLDIPLKLTCDINFELKTQAGTVNLNLPPMVKLNAEFMYGDAEVAVNSDIELIDYAVEDGEPIEIKDLPTELKKVNRVSMLQNDDSILNFYAHGMDWLGDLAEDIEVVVGLPSYLKLHHVDGESYDYNEATCEITTTIAQLDKGVKIAIEALDFGAEGLEPDSAGEIELDFEPSIRAHFKEGAQVNVSALKHEEEELNIEVGIEESRLAIESFSGKVDYTYEVDQSFEISGLEDLGLNLEIDGIGIKPIIEVNITHPLTISAMLSGSVTPSVGGVANEVNAVSFNNIELKPATYSNGAIEDAEVILIIADESLRASYTDERYTFVACDVTQLLCGSIPDALDINLELSVNSEQTQTLYITDNLSISYGYRLDVPFAIDDSLKVRYSDEIGDLNSLFTQLAEYDIQVGDVALIATITNTTPLQLAAQATLKDAEGNNTEAQVTIADGAIIEGSADGKTPQVSTLRFELELGEDGKVANIANVDAVAFELEATSAAGEQSVALSTEQYLGVKLQVELNGGITVDIDKLNM